MASLDTDVTTVPAADGSGGDRQSSSSLTSTKKSAANNNNKKHFELKKWNAIALWAWDIEVNNCAICRNHINDTCIECQANQLSATIDDCSIA